MRAQVAFFDMAASTLMKRSSEALAAARDGLGDKERAKRAKTAENALISLAAEWDKLIAALHAEDPSATKPAVAPAPRGRAARTGRTGAAT